VILGNFHPRNPDKALMDYVLDWKLIHRTEADMDRLFSNSSFNRPCTNVRFEDQGINLFAECIKA
jgi:extracellular factor (EF) 3-hydroxypalmitic acid methyl ester biosynthesis protein